MSKPNYARGMMRHARPPVNKREKTHPHHRSAGPPSRLTPAEGPTCSLAGQAQAARANGIILPSLRFSAILDLMSSEVDVAIVTGAFTLGAVILTYLGSGLRDPQQRSRQESAVCDQRVAEVIAAADGLRQRVRLYCSAWAVDPGKSTAAGVHIGRTARDLLPESTPLKLSNYRAATALTIAAELAVDGILGKLVNTAGTMYLEAVTPAVDRLMTAAAPLRTSSDASLAAAARELTAAGTTYADEAKSGGRNHKRADEAFDGCLTRFVSLGIRKKRAWWRRLGI